MLLTRILGYGDGWLTAEVRHSQGDPFSTNDGATPAWVALEYMAQTVSAYAGSKRRAQGQNPRIGFLLGTRDFSVSVSEFLPGSVVQIRATAILESDTEVSIFNCEVYDQDGHKVGSAQLKGVQPENPEAFI